MIDEKMKLNDDLIQEYLDGDISEIREDKLFSLLSGNTSLRSDFNNYMRLNTAARTGASSVIPPPALSSSVFAGLGYTIPKELKSGAASAVKYSIFSKYISHILTGLISAAFAVGIFVMVSPKSSVHTAEQKNIQAIQPGKITAKPAVENIIIDEHKKPIIRYIIKEVEKPAAQENQTPQLVNKVEKNVLPPVFINKISITGFQELEHQNKITGSYFSRLNINPVNIDNKIKNFEIQYRELKSLSFPNVNIPTKTGSSFNNMVISALYIIDDNNSIGFELGRESFGQEFIQRLDGQLVRIKQNPSLWWLDAAYHLDLPDMKIIENLFPYIQAGTGICEIGQIDRLAFGLRFMPLEYLTLNIGAEGAVMFYPIENRFYTSGKINLVYGISVKL